MSSIFRMELSSKFRLKRLKVLKYRFAWGLVPVFAHGVIIFSSGIEIYKDSLDGWEYFRLHHGIFLFAVANAVTKFNDFLKVRSDFLSLMEQIHHRSAPPADADRQNPPLI